MLDPIIIRLIFSKVETFFEANPFTTLSEKKSLTRRYDVKHTRPFLEADLIGSPTAEGAIIDFALGCIAGIAH